MPDEPDKQPPDFGQREPDQFPVCKRADIDLAAARNAPAPFIEDENNPYTRSLSEDEQADLVEAANHGMTAIEDILEDPNSFDEHRQFQEMEGLKERVTALLTVRQPDK